MNLIKKQKTIQTQIRDPVILGDGSWIFDITLTTSQPDRDGDIVNPLGVKGIETAVIAYNHKRCDGLPVSTGAKILKDTIIQNESELRVQIQVKPTDEMFFCDYNGTKRSNGKLLDAIKKDQVRAVSMGFSYNTETVQSKTIKGINYNYYPEVLLSEASLLDVTSSNLHTIIHKSMNPKKTLEQKLKCLTCLVSAGIGKYAINPDNNVVKVTDIDESTMTIKGTDFEGNETVLDDSYEPVEYEPHEDKMSTEPPTDEATKDCGCNKNKPTIVAEIKQDGSSSVVDPEDVKEDVQIQTVLENQSKMMEMLTQMMAKLESNSTEVDEAMVKMSTTLNQEMTKSIQNQSKSQIDAMIQKFDKQAQKSQTELTTESITSLI